MYVCAYICWCIYRFCELLYCLTRETQGRTKWFCAWRTPRRTVHVSLQCFMCLRELRSKSGQGQLAEHHAEHASDAGSSPQCSKGFSSPHSRRWVQTVLWCSRSHCVQWHYICSHVKLPKHWQLFQLPSFGSMKMQYALAQPFEGGTWLSKQQVGGGRGLKVVVLD